MNGIEDFESDGFGIIKAALSPEVILFLRHALEKLYINSSESLPYGVRNLLNVSNEIRAFAECKAVRSIAETFLGSGAKTVRAIYFDKTPEVNWKVPWHQDLTISVKERVEILGFAPWTKKAGIWHVQPDEKVLYNMITLRFHLDDADESNGALKVIPGSHKRARLSADEIKAIRMANETHVCRVKQGDCLVMRPLLLHSSSAGDSPRRRRVVHLEFSNVGLPGGLEWYGS